MLLAHVTILTDINEIVRNVNSYAYETYRRSKYHKGEKKELHVTTERLQQNL